MWPQRKFNSLWNPRCMAHSRCLVNASWPEFCFLEFALQRHLPKCIKMFTLVVMKGWTNPDPHPPRNLQSGLPWWLSHRNPPANAGNMGSVPGLGGSHEPRNNLAQSPQLSTCALEPGNHSYGPHGPPDWSLHTSSPCCATREITAVRSLQKSLQLGSSPHSLQLEKSCSNEDLAQSKINKNKIIYKKRDLQGVIK